MTSRLTLTLGLRWHFMPVPHAQRGFETAFDPRRFDPTKTPVVNGDGTITPTPNYDPLNGLVRNDVNGVPDNFTTRHEWYWNPSVGFAWDVFGDGKTSLRGGYGITSTRVFTGSDCARSCAANPPEITSLTLIAPSFPNPTGTGVAAPLGAPSLSSEDLDLRAAQIQTYSLTLEHEFPGNWFVSMGGAGNIGRHVPSQYDRLFEDNNSTQDVYHPRADYGNSDFNVAQLFSFSHVWSLPFFNDTTGWKHVALAGWKYAGTTTIQNGFSLDPMLSVDNQGLATRPNRVAGASVRGPKTASEWFNKSAFDRPPFGFFGDAGNGIIGGPGLVNFDMGFYKDFRVTEHHAIQFRSEFFNIFNHTNFNVVDTTFGDGQFGQVVGAADPRIIEFALRWQF